MGADMLDVLSARAYMPVTFKRPRRSSTIRPRPQAGRSIVAFPLPKGEDLAAASWSILTAVSTSKLAPDIGASLIASLAQIARITQISEFEKRLAALEVLQP
jgi:hypothetical protein